MSTQYIVGIVFVVRIGLEKVGWGLGLGWDGTGHGVGELWLAVDLRRRDWIRWGWHWNRLGWMSGTPRKEGLEAFLGAGPDLPTGWQRIVSRLG